MRLTANGVTTVKPFRILADPRLTNITPGGLRRAVKPMVDSLAAKLTGVEGGLIQSKSQSGQDPIRCAGRLDN